eukprot:1952964-Amphidinium_carterae.1
MKARTKDFCKGDTLYRFVTEMVQQIQSSFVQKREQWIAENSWYLFDDFLMSASEFSHCKDGQNSTIASKKGFANYPDQMHTCP